MVVKERKQFSETLLVRMQRSVSVQLVCSLKCTSV